jgi:hypothetical protein
MIPVVRTKQTYLERVASEGKYISLDTLINDLLKKEL